MLAVSGLNQSYGGSHTLWDVDLAVPAGSRTCLMGRNGMGKTTLLKCIMGLLPASSGKIEFEGRSLGSLAAEERAGLGIGYVPQGREIFPQLTVGENLDVGLGLGKGRLKKVPDLIFELFPVLKQMLGRRGGDLSGGQQQQLAIARALVSEPKLLILDEPTEGIQPSINKEIARTLKQLKTERGFSLLVSEQALNFALEVADRVMVIEKGEIVYAAPVASVDLARVHGYLTLATHGVDDSGVSPPVKTLEEGAMP